MASDPTPEDFCFDNCNGNIEEEDEEERLRCIEEIKNLLEVAMGDFNDDESTLISLNCSADQVEDSHVNLKEKYKDADYNDTLKALYEARTKELEKVSRKLEETERLKKESESIKQSQIICLQADLEQKKLALKQHEAVLVVKTEEVNQLSEEKHNFLKTVKELEGKVEELTEERDALRTANNNLHQQLTFLEKGFNPKQDADKVREGELRDKIDDLTIEIERLEKIIKKQDNEFTSYKHMMERMLQERDDICQEKENEIKKYNLELHKKEVDCINLNAEIQQLNREKEDLKYTLQKAKTTELCNLSLNNLNEQLRKLAAENREMKTKIQQYLQDLLEHKKLKEEYEQLKITMKEINKNEVSSKEKADKSLQVTDKKKKCDVGIQTDVKNIDSERVSKMKELQDENAFLREKDSQRREQEILLNDLQKVAKEFEKVIQERNSKTCLSQGTNTDDGFLETIKMYYETQIVKLEIQLREEIKEEFDKKLLQKEKQFKEIQKLSLLESEKNMKVIIQKMKDDRRATVELIDELRQKFLQIENEMENYKTKYLQTASENTELKKYLIKLKNDFQQELKMALQNYQRNYNYVIAKRATQQEARLKTKFFNMIKLMQMYNNKIAGIQGKN